MPDTGQLRIGTSGWIYKHWRGLFYPPKLPSRQWLAFYANSFDTVEINNTFYHLPQAQSFDAWREQASPNFCYALKFSRYGSHLKHLKEPHATLERFLERACRLLNVDTRRLLDALNAARPAPAAPRLSLPVL